MSEFDEFVEPDDSITLYEFQNEIRKEALARKGHQNQVTPHNKRSLEKDEAVI